MRLVNFDGGLNLRDAPTELGNNETPECMNVTLDERGGAAARLGIVKLNGSSLLPQAPSYLYYSTYADQLLAWVKNNGTGNSALYGSSNVGVTWTSLGLFPDGATGAIIDFAGINGPRVVIVNTLDGVWSYNTSLTVPVHLTGATEKMDEVRGDAIAVWQNKLWVAGDIREDTTHSKARVWRCVAGDEQHWTVATDFTDIRDVDTLPVTAIGAGSGMDVTGKPTLLVYKAGSMYRINDSGSGTYTTLHARGAGAASNKAVAATSGRICSINSEGIWVTDGLAIPLRVSDKLQPLFTADGLNLADPSVWAAAPYRDRIVFNVTRTGSATNNLMLEYHPEVGWTVSHQLALGPMAVYSKQTSKLIAGASASGKVFETFKGGLDDGVAIAARYQTPWFELGRGNEARLRQLRAFGRGNVMAQLRQDFTTAGENYTLAFATDFGFVWGVGVWGVGVWGDPATEGAADTALDQVCTHVSLVFSATSSTTAFRPPLLGDGTSVEIGPWALYEVGLDHIQLGT